MNKIAIFLLSLCLAMALIPSCPAADAVNVTPQPKSILNKNSEVEIRSDWRILVDSKEEDVLFAARYLNEELQDRFNFTMGIQKSASSNIMKSVALALSGKELPGLGDEAYTLEVFDDHIVINGNKAAGVFYGVQSLLQLIRAKEGKTVVQAVKVVDYPRLKYRGVHLSAPDLKRVKGYIDVMARLKLNIVIIDDWGYYDLDKESSQELFQEIFDYARERHIEPVPGLADFGPGGPILKKDPYAAEGIFAQDEHFKFVNNEAQPDNPSKHSLVNVIRSEDSDFAVENLDTTKTYEENRDYKFVEGDISYPYSLDGRPSRILRIPQGGIRDGEEVLISYDYVENKCASWAPWSVPYCPSSERTYKGISRGLENVINILKPRYINIGHDEIRGLNRDSRCKRRSMTNAQLLADDINKINDYVESLDPDIQLLMWDDMLNPWHNGADENYQVQFGGVPGKTQDAVDLMPKDIIIMIWWYDAKDWLNVMKNGPNYFESKGFKYLVAGWRVKSNIEDWAKLVIDRPNCVGMITTTWEGWDKNTEGIKDTAKAAW